MDACLVEAAPASEATSERPPFDAQRLLRWAVAGTILVGLTWRMVRYVSAFPIWGDEAMLLLNILDRDYAGLTNQLRFAQVAPLFFLWLEKLALEVLGPGELAVHLCPFLAGLAALFVFQRTCRAHFAPDVAWLAVAVLAVSYYPVRHACEVKPYVFDLGFATIFLSLTLAYLKQPENVHWLMALTVTAPIAVFTSYPSVFVAGSASLVLLPAMRRAAWSQRSWFVFFNVALVGAFLVHYGLVGRAAFDVEDAARAREYLQTYWKDAFPPGRILDWPLWLVKTFTGNMLAYPIGAKNGGSTVTFLLVLLGSFSIWRTGNRSLLASCWLPFGLNFIAAMLGKYPFGDSARITLHLAPFICILMAHGAVQVLDWIRSPDWRLRLHLAMYLLLTSFGAISIARDLASPYKTEHDRDVRRLARDIGIDVAPGEPVILCHQRDDELIAEFLWYLRTERLALRWQSEGVAKQTASFWRIECSNQMPAEVGPSPGWTIFHSEVRMAPPENKVMPPMYCRWTKLVRD